MGPAEFEVPVNLEGSNFEHPYAFVRFLRPSITPFHGLGVLVPCLRRDTPFDLGLHCDAVYGDSEADWSLSVVEQFSPFDEENKGEPGSIHDYKILVRQN